MATASVSITPECSICYESLKTPKILPCGHTFCLCCIDRYIADKRKTFSCPSCQQDVKIPDGGAQEFTTNFIVQTSKHTTLDQLPSTTQPKCPNHDQREVDYYCNDCNVGLCSKCIFQQHNDHEILEIDCDETRNKAIEKFQCSYKIINSRLQNFKGTRSTLLESFEQLKSICEDSCAKVTEKTEQIVSDLKASCDEIIKDIMDNLEENRSKVEDLEMEITSDINILESNMESIISPLTETTLNILITLPRLKEIETQGENRKDYDLCVQYLQWKEDYFGLDIDQLGFVISKPFYIPGSYQFIFDVNDLEEDDTEYYSKNKFRNNNLVWSCCVRRNIDDDFSIHMELLSYYNLKLNYCIIDGKISLLNIDDDNKTLTKTESDKRFERGGLWSLWYPITWSKLTDENNGYVNSNGQFVVQFDTRTVNIVEGVNETLTSSSSQMKNNWCSVS